MIDSDMMASKGRISGADAVSACRRTSEAMLGRVIDQVRYVGLSFETSRPDWDFVGWHWPVVGVEMLVADLGPVHAIWSWRATHFHLQFAEGGLESEVVPLRDDPEHANVWDVTDHPAWASIVGSPIKRAALALGQPDDPPVDAPIAVKLVTARAAVWLVAGAPREWDRARPDITADDVYLGHDEMLVVFDDIIAKRIGLLEAISIEPAGGPSP